MYVENELVLDFLRRLVGPSEVAAAAVFPGLEAFAALVVDFSGAGTTAVVADFFPILNKVKSEKMKSLDGFEEGTSKNFFLPKRKTTFYFSLFLKLNSPQKNKKNLNYFRK